MKTTLELPDTLFKRANARAALEGLKFKDLVASALSTYLAQPNRNAKSQAKPRRSAPVHAKAGPLLKTRSKKIKGKSEPTDDLERYRRSF